MANNKVKNKNENVRNEKSTYSVLIPCLSFFEFLLLCYCHFIFRPVSSIVLRNYGVNLIHETLFVTISTDDYNTGTNCWIFPSSHLTETIKDGWVEYLFGVDKYIHDSE